MRLWEHKNTLLPGLSSSAGSVVCHRKHWTWESLMQYECQSSWPTTGIWERGQSHDTWENPFPNVLLEDWLPRTATGNTTEGPSENFCLGMKISLACFVSTSLFWQPWQLYRKQPPPSDCCPSQQTHTLCSITQSYRTLSYFTISSTFFVSLSSFFVIHSYTGRRGVNMQLILVTLMYTNFGLF